MYFIKLDEEKLAITEEVLKSYGVHYTIEKIRKPVKGRYYKIEYAVKADVSVEFFDYLTQEIDGKDLDRRFEEAKNRNDLSYLERCYEIKNKCNNENKEQEIFNKKDYIDRSEAKQKEEKNESWITRDLKNMGLRPKTDSFFGVFDRMLEDIKEMKISDYFNEHSHGTTHIDETFENEDGSITHIRFIEYPMDDED